MDFQKAVDEIITQSILSFNQTVDTEQQLQNSNSTIIFGPGSNLDSLGFVNFIVTIESEVDSNLNKTIFIVDEEAMEMAENPFRTIESLKKLLVKKLQAE
jgi:acyl carrier protein